MLLCKVTLLLVDEFISQNPGILYLVHVFVFFILLIQKYNHMLLCTLHIYVMSHILWQFWCAILPPVISKLKCHQCEWRCDLRTWHKWGEDISITDQSKILNTALPFRFCALFSHIQRMFSDIRARPHDTFHRKSVV